jgi:hypothetical protein
VSARSHGRKGCRERQARRDRRQDGRWRGAKFAKENALLSPAVRDGQQDPDRGRRRQAGKDAGATIALKDYVRFQLGEGIEKEESDFAAEVAAPQQASDHNIRRLRHPLMKHVSGWERFSALAVLYDAFSACMRVYAPCLKMV